MPEIRLSCLKETIDKLSLYDIASSTQLVLVLQLTLDGFLVAHDPTPSCYMELNILIYYIKVSGIPSGNKLIKTIQYPHM